MRRGLTPDRLRCMLPVLGDFSSFSVTSCYINLGSKLFLSCRLFLIWGLRYPCNLKNEAAVATFLSQAH